MVPPPVTSVAILLGAKNGQRFLAEQLDSIEAQTFTNWAVWASDDASADGTPEILQKYRERWGDRLSILQGPDRGCAANFLSLLCCPTIQAAHYAFADQDDIWEPEKLARAVEWLSSRPPDVPALYCSRTQIIDESGHGLRLSPYFPKPPEFRNALVQNISSGNTMVFNDAARKLLQAVGPETEVAVHDWLTYLIVSGCGGEINYSHDALVRHRLHSDNLINRPPSRLIEPLKIVTRGSFRVWVDLNVRALRKVRPLLTPENRLIFDEFASARERYALPKAIGLMRSGIYRQSRLENFGLMVAALLNRW